jgi:hypothetical protein
MKLKNKIYTQEQVMLNHGQKIYKDSFYRIYVIFSQRIKTSLIK